MTDVNFIKLVKSTVCDYVNEHVDETNGRRITTDYVFIVWSCKTLQNWKAIAGTMLLNGMYYELTINGDGGEMYLNVYKKLENRTIAL